MNLFNAQLVTLRKLFKNEYDDLDRNKNYYIPLYQRKYNWAEQHVEDLISDINELYEDSSTFKPYFLGGIVLSRESIEGDEKTKESLEVIDGQQRLTTLSIILSIAVQIFKFTNRIYEGKEEFIASLSEDIGELIISKKYTDDYKIKRVLKVERSDNIKDIYENTLKSLLVTKVNFNIIDKNLNNKEEKDFIKNVQKIYEKMDLMEDDRILHFILQLLDHTHIVVTKTDNVTTGYTVFEKLNDRGEGLNAADLLKNYLFSIKTDEEDTQDLKNEWDNLLKLIENIKGSISPKDFLENYLVIVGSEYLSSKTSDIFKAYKQYFKNKNYMLELSKMQSIAKYYATLKDTDCSLRIINGINFKLGHLIFLSFYNKYVLEKSYKDEYEKYQLNILHTVFKFGFVYLLIGKTKITSKIITKQCKLISNSQENILDTINLVESEFHGLIQNSKEEFKEQISSNNRYKRAYFTQVLIDIINFHIHGKSGNDKFPLFRLMPEDMKEVKELNDSFSNINEDNIVKYANMIGNLTVLAKDISEDCKLDFESKMSCISSNSSLLYNKLLLKTSDDEIKYSNPFVKLLVDFDYEQKWGKETILKRSENISKIAENLFVNNDLDINYFK